MLKLVLALMFFCLFQNACYKEEGPPLPPIKDFSIINERNTWLVLENGKVIHFLNDSQENEEKTFPAKLRQIFFLNTEEGFASDSDGKIWATTNAGKDWLLKKHFNNESDFDSSSQLVFFDNQIGWLITSFSVWLTENGGNTWSRVYPNTEFSYGKIKAQPMIYFSVTSDIGWLGMSNGKILKTTNRGKVWENVSINGNFDIRTLFAFNENECWVGTWGKGGLFHTSDGGKNWKQILDDNMSTNLGINSIHFVNDKVGWIAGRKFVTNSDNPENNTEVLLKTTDGGKSWDKIVTGLKEDEFTFVKFIDENNGWLIGEKTIYKSQDGGGHWKSVFVVDETRRNE